MVEDTLLDLGEFVQKLPFTLNSMPVSVLEISEK